MPMSMIWVLGLPEPVLLIGPWAKYSGGVHKHTKRSGSSRPIIWCVPKDFTQGPEGGKTDDQNLSPGSDKSECNPRPICTQDPSNILVGSFADARVWCLVHGSKISACHAPMDLATPAHGADSPWIRVPQSIGRHCHGCPCRLPEPGLLIGPWEKYFWGP